MLTPDKWDSARFQAVFCLEAGSVKIALSRPAHLPVTQAVSLLIANSWLEITKEQND